MLESEKPKRARGTGSIFTMKGSDILWIKYHKNGVPVRESSHSTRSNDAEKLLRRRLGEIEAGTFTGPKLLRIRVDELCQDLMDEYRANGRKSFSDLEARWRLHLKPFFGGLRAVQVTTQLVDRYKVHRREQGAENATINRELAALKRMFSIARRSTPPKVAQVPYIATLKEDNVRTGFVEPAEYDRLVVQAARFGLWLRTLVELGYSYGFRHEELVSMKVRQADLSTGTIRLNPGETKNSKGPRSAHDSQRAPVSSPVYPRQAIGRRTFHPRRWPAGPRFSRCLGEHLSCLRAGANGLPTVRRASWQ